MQKFSVVLSLFLFIYSNSLMSDVWNVQSAHTEVIFKVLYLNSAYVTGHFSKIKGSLELEKDVIQNVEISLSLDSLYTGNSMRDGHLKGKDFFHVKKYPKAFFRIQKPFPLDSKNKRQGLLSFHGVERVVPISVNYLGKKEDTWGYESLFFEFSFKLNRSEFNLNWNKTLDGNEFLISDEVDVSGVLQFQPANKMTPSSKHKIPDTKVIRNRERFQRGEIEESQLLHLKEERVVPEKSEEKKTKEVVASTNPPEVYKAVVSRDSLSQWLAYIVVFLYGVVGAIWCSLLIKKNRFFSQSRPREILADLFVILLFMVLSGSLFSLMPF